MKNPKTTVAGCLGGLGALMTFVAYWLTHGVPPAEAWAGLGTALSFAASAVLAADGKKPE